MPRPRWYEQLLDTTRGKVLALLRIDVRTVGELAGDLGLTGNAVRRHLTALERDGLVEPGGVRREGVGKPARIYRLTEQGQEFFPRAYGVLLSEVLTALELRHSREEVEEVLCLVGRRLAEAQRASGFPRTGPLESRVRSAVQLLEELGGVPTLERRNGGFRIRGHSCPLAAAVEEHPEACTLAQKLLEELLGAHVSEHCERNGRARCVFDVSDDSS